jgi:hypothetical protein
MRLLWRSALIAVATGLCLASLPAYASKRHAPYPVTLCGPDFAYLCRLHGSFDDAPFHYNLAIHPGCIKTVGNGRRGAGRAFEIVCGAPPRQMIWW